MLGFRRRSTRSTIVPAIPMLSVPKATIAYVTTPGTDSNLYLMAFHTMTQARDYLSGIGLRPMPENEDVFETALLDGKRMPLEKALAATGPAADLLRENLFSNGLYDPAAGGCDLVFVWESEVGTPMSTMINHEAPARF